MGIHKRVLLVESLRDVSQQSRVNTLVLDMLDMDGCGTWMGTVFVERDSRDRRCYRKQLEGSSWGLLRFSSLSQVFFDICGKSTSSRWFSHSYHRSCAEVFPCHPYGSQ